MAPTHHVEDDEEQDLTEEFIDSGDVLAELDLEEGDQPMDDDDDDDEARPEHQEEEEDVEDNSVQAFSNHEGSVFAIAAHPTSHLAASGAEDDTGYIWDITDGEVIAKLSGHTDSVTSVAFSRNGEMIATGGMDGKVRVWRRVGKDDDYRIWEFLTELQGPDEVMWIRWHPKGTVLLAGSNDTTVWLWQLPSGATMQVFAGHSGPVTCGDFTPDGKRIVTACAEGTLILWDPRESSPIFKLSATDGRFDLGGITSLAINATSTLAVVGGAEGGVRAVSLSKGEVVGALGGHEESGSIEAIQFIDIGQASSVVVTGGTDGKARIWDLNTMRLRSTLDHQDAVTTLVTRGYLIVSGSADKKVRTWDGRTGTLLREHTGHQGPVHGVDLALDGEVVVSAGDDGICFVYTTDGSMTS